MYKILIECERENNKIKSKEPYFILVERVPLLESVNGKTLWYQTNFSSRKKAKSCALQIEKYLDNSFIFLDLIYTKIKQLEFIEVETLIFNKNILAQMELSRIALISSSKSPNYAWYFIEKFNEYIKALKRVCFIVDSKYFKLASSLWDFLIEFEASFIRTYRSFGVLSNGGQLQFFL
ncbi:hypothetical protein SAMN05421847_0482 [Halpernia humi]|uniref:Uncharacterized protein n=1 Tax=Halpernia humi TaxID=493375 RepID=A0A1H5THX0_9FLAO|nr:hypothetical protein [Halpernia humi]SEF62462.1 hypothetical protein SAMN05421847_0482 [Halpernia humi]